jgi:hypothetical protein
VDGLVFNQILGHEAGWLEREFEEGEVRKFVMAMEGDKAPGPDGFSIASVLGSCQRRHHEDL